jgi:Sulfotransferase domain
VPAEAAPIGGMDRSSRVQRLRDRLPSGAVSAAKGAVLASGRVTSSLRVLPDFLIIGCKKGGTTSLMNWLVEHPDVARMYPSFQRRKSPHYFDINYARGEAWYRAHFPTRQALDRQRRRTGRRPLVGEASPYYMFHPAAPERIRETLPDVRLIALLREPVSRAYSNYWDRVATGNEDLPSFEAAIDAEEERLSAVTPQLLLDPAYYSFHHDHHSYLARGRYLEHLEPWLTAYPADRLLVLPAEDMFRTPQAVFEAVQRFLGLPVRELALRPRNERRSGYPPIQPETKARLTAYYEPHNRALFTALGREFAW